jgi:hypothetical protein
MNYEIIINSIASIGVVLSVIFLAYEIKKNTQASRANYYDSLNKTNMEFLRQLVENRELGELLEKATSNWDNLNEDDKRTSNYLFIQLFRHWENMFYQHKLSVLDKQLWTNHLNTMIGYFHHDGTQEWWLKRKMAFAKDFRDFLEKTEKPKQIYPTIKDLTIENK